MDKSGKESKIPKGEMYVGDLHIGMETVPKNLLNDIIDRRLGEAFKFVQIYIKKAGYDKKLPAGVVLTGGAALTKGIEKIASDVFNLPVRVGKPLGVAGLVDQVQGPQSSAVVGTIKFVADRMKSESSSYNKRSGNIGKMGSKVISFLKSFLP